MRLPAPATPRGAAVRLSVLLFVCRFAAQSAFLVLGPILPAVARAFGTSSAAAGRLRTLSGVAGGVTALALAVLGRRIGLRLLLPAGLWLLLLASPASAPAPSFAVLAVAQLAIGVGIAILLAGAVAAAAEWAPPGARSGVLAWDTSPAVCGLLLGAGAAAYFPATSEAT